MARIIRSDFDGAAHHVYGRGNGKQTIFQDDEDRDFFLRRLEGYSRELDFRVLGYCLMGNHYHLALQTGDRPLSLLMQRLLTSYARVFNDRWRTVGHPFQGRYGARRCKDDNDLRGVIRYIHMNPVEAGLADSPAHWGWSGHLGLIGSRTNYPLVDVAFVWELFGGLNEYRDYLAQPRFSKETVSLDSIAVSIGTQDQVRALRGASRTRESSELRREFLARALEAGYRRSEIARYLNRSGAAMTYLLRTT